MKKALGLALPGGGLRQIFVVCYLVGVYLMGIRLRVIVASSADVGTASYWASGQILEMIDIWTKELSGGKFIRLWPWPMMNLAKLIFEIFGSEYLFDFNKAKNSGIRLFVSATDIETG